MIIYLDLLFGLNALADYVLLYVAGRLTGARVRHTRLLAGALWGGVYACAQPFGVAPWAFSFAGVLGAAAVMLAIAYAPVPWRQALRLAGAFLATAAALAGAVFALMFARAAGAAGVLHWWMLAAPLLAAVLCVRRFGGQALQRWRTAAGGMVAVAVGVGGREVVLVALVDTGNHLLDPLGQDPVVVVEARALRALLPPDLLRSASHRAPAWEEVVGALEGSSWAARLRLIPYSALGTQAGMLVGFRPDRARVAGRQVVPTIGLAAAPLDPHGRYQALCPAALLEPTARAS